MHRTIATAAILSAGFLAACEMPGPDRVETSRPTVSFEYGNDEELADATEQADEYCEAYNQEARLSDTDERDEGEDIAIFECR
jgi:hypothetical protein